MNAALWLLALQGAIGAFDTIYYHELRGRLTAYAASATRGELLLHGVRAVIYAFLFALLPHITIRGAWTVVVALLLAAEIVITLCDFVVEDDARRPLGGLPAGERVTHAVMGIVYGAMLANLAPVLLAASREPTAVFYEAATVPVALRWTLLAMSAGVLLSGVRDLAAALGVRGAAWPWLSPRRVLS